MASTGSSSSVANSDAAPAAVDVVVGLATCNHARTAGAVARAIRSGLARHGPSLSWRVVLADAGSSDGTRERVREAVGAGDGLVEVAYALQPSDASAVPFHGLPGRARGVRQIFGQARALNARACVVVDALATTLAPGWVERIVQPLAAGEADFVAAAYSRHPISGALVHGVVYPIFRALYGARLREPVAADFGCSPRLIDAVLADPIWDSEIGQVGIDLWLAATAVSGGFRVGQAMLGPRPRERRDELDLSTTLSQLIGCVFADMERRVLVWQRVRGSRAVPQFGDPPQAPDSPDVDVASLIEPFRLGCRELQEVWSEVLPPLAILQWRRLAGTPIEAFRVEDVLWARTVYDFAMGHRLRVIARDHLLRSLVPLYLAWLASFFLQVHHATPEQAEDRIDRLCLAFEAEKPYLISQWRWPERFRPVRIRR